MMDFDSEAIFAPEISDQEWIRRFATGYRQSFDRDSLEDANIALDRIFDKYDIAKAV